MGTFTLTRRAKTDLKSIAAYTQRKWGKEQRRIYAKQFDDIFHMLAESPDAGAKCDYLMIGYRKFPCSSHMIFYRGKSGAEIEIVRVLHKRVDVQQQLRNP
ncbi:MAG: type II toxin-antitoxin system RelE/ParE family toxin [Motiliproteus sp.]|nr:type II toxin-antitoxin system RelE/ParE family toxin [Motiliproteus sp.]